VIEGNTEPERQTPMWGRGRIDHVGLQAASPEAFATIRQRLIDVNGSRILTPFRHLNFDPSPSC
jgi:hypothetical protein